MARMKVTRMGGQRSLARQQRQGGQRRGRLRPCEGRVHHQAITSSVLSPSQSPFLPDWLREGVVDDNEDEIKPKELKADEVDHKRGIRKVAMMQTRTEAPSCPASGMRSPSTPVLDDTVLAEEVDMELRRRREQEKATKERMDKRTLSNDTNALRGGGARAMMRQLEEAEKKERRADLQRRRSSETHIHRPKVSSPPSKEPEPVPVQMGAVKDVPAKPFTPPPRLNSPDVMVSQPPIKRTQSPLEALRARSPFKRTDSSNSNEGRSTPPAVENATSSSPHSSSPLKKSAPLPAESRPAAEVAKATSGAAIEKTGSTSDQPSLLIRRELSLGIPLHNARSGSGSPSLQLPQAGGTGSSRGSSSSHKGKEAIETPSDSSSSLVKDSGSLRQPHARSHASLPRYGSPLGGAEPSLGMRPDPAKVSRRHSAFVGNGNGTVPGTSSPLASSGRHSDEVDRRGAASSSSGLHTVKAPQISEEAAARRERERGDSKLGRAKTWGHSLFGKMRP
ncbi:hypothetical protein FA10DRAFT_74355 [Acaromyces ingoldii]|uniref:Uncharacterized protein n=1 Tax=Acaromyces ingoldii TaxID=215250 RepID=A0A316YSU2_9BASI|nr:hypothetical protein FA10DRAFT_74355 [Acaromyces ingoldii]PWN91738.1 hypothetical protein FA10DRAFT_74355 [Acaromyces ingoldii]